ncbi:MAG TPA: LPS assembly lipoprotein LptE [Wenzhouxiangella sp.]
MNRQRVLAQQPRTHRGVRWLLIFITAVVLTGCGFQLRGQIDLPESMRQMALSTPDATTDFVRELTGQLRANGVRLTDGPTVGASRLIIERERVYREALTISQDARVREYVLYLEVRFGFLDAAGEPIIDNEVMRLSREYRFDEQAILGSSREEEVLTQDLSRELATQLVRRLASQNRADQ